jgi:hypothetical protein
MKFALESKRLPASGQIHPARPCIRGGSVLAAAVITAVSLVSGCITTHETVRNEPERLKVEFEDEQAARVFYEALSRMPKHDDRRESTTRLHIPVVLDVSRTVMVSENVAFNQAVRRCDTNQDGKITRQEAHLFAEHVGP